MTLKLTIAAAFVLATNASAFAQSTGTTTAAAATPAPTSTTVRTDAQGKALIGAPLGYNNAVGAPDLGKPDTLVVLGAGNVKPAGEWTAADRKTCSDSGGIELPLSAGRLVCFKF